jgi:hypothetical protein
LEAEAQEGRRDRLAEEGGRMKQSCKQTGQSVEAPLAHEREKECGLDTALLGKIGLLVDNCTD